MQKGCLPNGGRPVKKFRFLILAVLTAALLVSGSGLVRAQAKKLTAVATITIIQDIAKNIAGDKLDIDFLVPTDGDVHVFEPTPGDVKKIAGADLILVNGVGLEQFLDKLIADSGTKGKVITVSQGLGIQKFLSIEARAEATAAATQGGSAANALPAGVIGISGSYQCGVPQAGEDIGEC